MSIRDLKNKSLSVLFIRSTGVLLLFGLTLFLTNFFPAEEVGRYDFVRSSIMILGGLALMGTNQSIIYYSGLLRARESIESIRSIYLNMLKIILFLSVLIIMFFLLVFSETSLNDIFNNKESYTLILKVILSLIFFTVTMLNVDTIGHFKEQLFLNYTETYLDTCCFLCLQ